MDTKEVLGEAKPLATLGWKEKVALALGRMGLTERRIVAWSAVPLEEPVLVKLASTKDPTVLAGLLGREELTPKVREQIYRSIANLPREMGFWDVEEAVRFFTRNKEEQERMRAYYGRYRGELLNALLARCERDELPWKLLLRARLPEGAHEVAPPGSPAELLGELLEVPYLFPATLKGLFAHPDPRVVRVLLTANLPTAERLPSREELEVLLGRKDLHLFAGELAHFVGGVILPELPKRYPLDEEEKLKGDLAKHEEFLLEVLQRMREAEEAGAVQREAHLSALRKLVEVLRVPGGASTRSWVFLNVPKETGTRPWVFLGEEALRLGDTELARAILKRLPEELRPSVFKAWGGPKAGLDKG